ncbi:MAG: cupredoxin domain-containing protein [Dehalococcoidia bacterium]|nr:cupredoxin domain-containing protein [Dehalococcoidia bacterium]
MGFNAALRTSSGIIALSISTLLMACAPYAASTAHPSAPMADSHGIPHQQDHVESSSSPAANSEPTRAYALDTHFSGAGFTFEGHDEVSSGAVNPVLKLTVGDVVKITLTNGDGIEHDFVIPSLGIHAGHVSSKGQSRSVVFSVTRAGEYAYYCSVPGHRETGMEGKLVIEA